VYLPLDYSVVSRYLDLMPFLSILTSISLCSSNRPPVCCCRIVLALLFLQSAAPIHKMARTEGLSKCRFLYGHSLTLPSRYRVSNSLVGPVLPVFSPQPGYFGTFGLSLFGLPSVSLSPHPSYQKRPASSRPLDDRPAIALFSCYGILYPFRKLIHAAPTIRALI